MGVQALCLRTILVGVTENSKNIQIGFDDELPESLDVRLGLPREPCDHVAANTGCWFGLPDPFDQSEKSIRVTKTPHTPQHSGRCMLEGEIEIGHYFVGVEHDLQHSGADLGGL